MLDVIESDIQAVAAEPHEEQYAALLTVMRRPLWPLFGTDAQGLYDVYLDALPSERQYHTCSACRQFITRFGNLVSIGHDGVTEPIWPETPTGFYAAAIAEMRRLVRKARVTGPFLSKTEMLGTARTGAWTHFSVSGVPMYRHALLTPGQAMAAKREDYRNVATALAEITAPMLDEALRLLKGEHLNRSERFVAPVQWLRDLHDRPKGRLGENLLWKAVSTAPDGYCHPRVAVTGTLLEDIAAGFPFDDIKRRFSAKTGGLVYQRPQAAPSSANIAQAEKIVEQMGIAPSLARRFARLDEIEAIWKPVAWKPPASAGVFGHLTAKAPGMVVLPVDVPAVTMTWEKFARTILAEAERIDLMVPRGLANFTAMLTAENADAPPILKWDNPVSLYVYHAGSPAFQWGLAAGYERAVTAIARRPNEWGERPQPYLGEGIVFVLEGAVDSKTDAGNALFPEMLKAELHAVRSTIEAYSRTAVIGGRERASACGLGIGPQTANVRLRVTTSGRAAEYLIDRWD
jgi:hypothetical protein